MKSSTRMRQQRFDKYLGRDPCQLHHSKNEIISKEFSYYWLNNNNIIVIMKSSLRNRTNTNLMNNITRVNLTRRNLTIINLTTTTTNKQKLANWQITKKVLKKFETYSVYQNLFPRWIIERFGNRVLWYILCKGSLMRARQCNKFSFSKFWL